MNRLLFILALTSILLQNFGKMYILLHFEINKTYIAKNLCVKKDDPHNCCKGSCYLKNQLAEEEKKEQSPASPGLKDKEEIQYCQNIQQFFFAQYLLVVLHAAYLPPVSEGINQSIFRPPKV